MNFLKAFKFFYMLPILVIISADVLRKFDCCTVHGLTLLTKARSSWANEHVPLIQSGRTIEWKRTGFARTTMVHLPDLLRSCSRLHVLYHFSHFYAVCNTNSCPMRSNCIGDSFLLGFLFYLSESWALWMGWSVFSWGLHILSLEMMYLCVNLFACVCPP